MGFAQPLADLTDHPLSGLRVGPAAELMTAEI
jgi:hypothetical protein